MYKLEKLSIADLNIIKQLASDKVLGSIAEKEIIDYWDNVHTVCKKEINRRVAELFPIKP